MSTWASILLDIGVLALLGTAYYLYQRRKIIRVSREDILSDLERFRFQLNKFSEDNANSNALRIFNNEFEALYQSGDFSQLTKMSPNGLNSELKDFYEALCQQILDHLKITPSL
jgi:hypothetical protein